MEKLLMIPPMNPTKPLEAMMMTAMPGGGEGGKRSAASEKGLTGSLLAAILLALFIVLASSAARGEILSLSVDDRPLKTEYIVVVDEIFVPAQELVRVYRREDLSWDPSTLWVKIGEKELPQKGLEYQGMVYLPLKALARELGYKIEFDQSRNKLNINTFDVAPPAAEAGKETGRAGDRPAEGTRKRKGVVISLFLEDAVTNVLKQVTLLRIYADVKNERGRPAENIEAHCIFRYPKGEVYKDDVVSIDRLAPGESRRVIFFTNNPPSVEKLEYELSVQIKKKVQK
ncbi:MAG: hypothetical protein RDV48_04745 [Candidatus Eremiobacteraeota bacterium]|nr:hypothetical protein [Candidatus Eremiobacteraeota bacterium]